MHTNYGHQSVVMFSEMIRNTGYDYDTFRIKLLEGLDICEQCQNEKQKLALISEDKKNQQLNES